MAPPPMTMISELGKVVMRCVVRDAWWCVKKDLIRQKWWAVQKMRRLSDVIWWLFGNAEAAFVWDNGQQALNYVGEEFYPMVPDFHIPYRVASDDHRHAIISIHSL